MRIRMKVVRVTADLTRDRKVRIPAWVIESRNPGPCLLLTAAQHGNEVQGAEAIRRFVKLASERLKRGKVFAVPLVNLPAVRQRRPHIRMRPEQAYGDDRGHNMNRWWPGKRSGNDTARIPYAICREFGHEATHAFDLHCWGKHNAPAVLIRNVPHIRELAGKLGHRFVDIRPPGRDFTLGGYFCATGRVGFTYEFSGQYTISEVQVRRGLMLITNLAKAIGLLPGRLIKGDSPVLMSDKCDTVQVTAPRSGLFVKAGLQVCQPVDKGALLGHIISDVNLTLDEVRAPVSGYLRKYGASRPKCDVAMPGHHPYVTKGENLAAVTFLKGSSD